MRDPGPRTLGGLSEAETERFLTILADVLVETLERLTRDHPADRDRDRDRDDPLPDAAA